MEYKHKLAERLGNALDTLGRSDRTNAKIWNRFDASTYNIRIANAIVETVEDIAKETA